MEGVQYLFSHLALTSRVPASSPFSQEGAEPDPFIVGACTLLALSFPSMTIYAEFLKPQNHCFCYCYGIAKLQHTHTRAREMPRSEHLLGVRRAHGSSGDLPRCQRGTACPRALHTLLSGFLHHKPAADEAQHLLLATSLCGMVTRWFQRGFPQQP